MRYTADLSGVAMGSLRIYNQWFGVRRAAWHEAPGTRHLVRHSAPGARHPGTRHLVLGLAARPALCEISYYISDAAWTSAAARRGRALDSVQLPGRRTVPAVRIRRGNVSVARRDGNRVRECEPGGARRPAARALRCRPFGARRSPARPRLLHHARHGRGPAADDVPAKRAAVRARSCRRGRCPKTFDRPAVLLVDVRFRA